MTEKALMLKTNYQVSAGTSSMGGNGLRNMQMRAKEMKGECRIESTWGTGTVVILRFPA